MCLYRPRADQIRSSAEKLRSTFEAYLTKNTQLPLWPLPPHLANLDDGTRRHIADLKMPVTSLQSQLPSLLLHNLGQPSHDPQLAERVDGLFKLEWDLK